ncbi:polysaccharide deacetylase family protein [Actinoplanes regularis]|uniref:polysaccharide deacetylase family protein n=1 Tax=Actinoplanes regularis TaxID=52697 RepID=UPI0025537E5B|nr:polysaccharide deacetylase family protein [Actinoplanes regularis]GLW27827.1 hypothetical protein Areg01_07670 [Actinoplanes regularis]
MPDEPSATTPGDTTPDQPVAPTTGTAPEEPTVALPPATAPEEPTVAVTAATAPEDSTVALTPATAPDEPTVALTTATTPEEPTVALTAPPTADEVTEPVHVSTPPDEATIALPAHTDRDELTVALSAGALRLQDDATVALPAGEPPTGKATAPVPPAPGVTVAAPAEPAGPRLGGVVLTRRRLLLGLTGVAGVAGVAATATAVAGRSATPESAGATAGPASASPATTRPRVPESTTVPASPAPVLHRPIATLAEYTKATGAPAFPTDAIALTIDDGPHPVWTPKILQLLDRYHVPALFCMIGNQVLGHEDVAQMVTNAGHQLANHTWSHPLKLGSKPKRAAAKEIEKAQAKISKTTGQTPKLFRSPGGDWSPQLLQGVAQAGLLPLDWSNDPRDWAQPGVASIQHRMLSARPGQILLCHDGGGDRSQTYKALSTVLPALKARGLQFVAL